MRRLVPAVLSLILASPAFAVRAVRVAAPAPIGPVPPAWARVFEPGFVLGSPALTARAFPPGVQVDAVFYAAHPEVVLPNLAPVVAILKKTPAALLAMTPAKRRAAIEAAVGEADTLVLRTARRALLRAEEAQSETAIQASFTELGQLTRYWAYYEASGQILRSDIEKALLALKARAALADAAKTAAALAPEPAPSVAVLSPAAEALHNQETALKDVRTLGALEAELRSELVIASDRIMDMALPGNEPVQRAAVRAQIHLAEIALRKYDDDTAKPGPDAANVFFENAAKIAEASRFPNVRLLFMHGALDNMVTARHKGYHVPMIADAIAALVSRPDAPVGHRDAALGLLRRELKAGADETALNAAMERIRASAAKPLLIEAAPARRVRTLSPVLVGARIGTVLAGVSTIASWIKWLTTETEDYYGRPIPGAEHWGWPALIALGLTIAFGVLWAMKEPNPEQPWYRKD